jgi:transcription factor IIIB subunit 2
MQVAAVCIYIHCRQEKKAYMMIDFSDQLSINVFELGKVYVQLLQKLCLDRDETFTKPIDPSLYLYRFVDRLKPGNKKKVSSWLNESVTLLNAMCEDTG